MPDSLFYTPEELAKVLKISRGTAYDLLKKGAIPSYRVGKKIRVSHSALQAYINPSDSSVTLPEPNEPPAHILSGSSSPSVTPAHSSLEKLIIANQGLIIAGQDTILDMLTLYMEKANPLLRSLRSYVGSVDALLALYRGTANAAGIHLWDGTANDYNLPYTKHYLPGQHVTLINLAYRTQGFYVTPGNPKRIKDWNDLCHSDVLFINQDKGSGTRVLLDEELSRLGIDARSIQGYENEGASHIAVASAVARGLADVGLGTEKAALQVANVEFVPLKKERYDLALYTHDLEKINFQTMLSILRSQDFREEIAGMGGYDTSDMGRIMGRL